MKILTFLTHSMKYIWYSPQKSKYPLFIYSELSPVSAARHSTEKLTFGKLVVESKDPILCLEQGGGTFATIFDQLKK